MQYLKLLFLACLLFLGCGNSKKCIREITDVSEEYKFECIPIFGRTSSVVVKVKGELDGDAIISVYRGDYYNLIKTPLKKGLIDTLIRQDWYDDTLRVEYKPINSTKGKLKIQCRFY